MEWAATYLNHAAALFVALAVLVIVEIALPRGRAAWVGRLQGLTFWVIALAGASTSVFLSAALIRGFGIHPLLNVRLPWPLAMLAIALVGDFFYYWFHRAQHAWPVLWRLHAVHHSIRDLSAVNSYHHWTEEMLRVIPCGLPVALLIHIDYAVIPGAALVMSLQGYLLHANTRINLGPLSRIIADNRTHRVHHSREASHFGKNYGSFSTVWDRLFGTSCFPDQDEWPDVGLSDRPELSTLTGYLLAATTPPPSYSGRPTSAGPDHPEPSRRRLW